jgi:hypothetical protein
VTIHARRVGQKASATYKGILTSVDASIDACSVCVCVCVCVCVRVSQDVRGGWRFAIPGTGICSPSSRVPAPTVTHRLGHSDNNDQGLKASARCKGVFTG